MGGAELDAAEADAAEAGGLLLARLGILIDQHLSRPPAASPAPSRSRLRRR